MTDPALGTVRSGPGERVERSLAAVFSGSTAVSALTSLLSLAASAVILRTLPVADAGRFALIASLVQVIAVVGAVGQPGLMMRLYSHQGAGHFNWLRDVWGALRFSLPLLALGVVGCALGYGLSFPHGLVLAGGTVLLTVSHSAAHILNSQRHYTWSAMLLRLPMGLMVLPALVVVIAPETARLNLMLGALVASVGVTVLAALGRLHACVARGATAIDWRVRWHGVGFGALAITHLLPDQGLVIIAGAAVAPEELAAYAALSVLVRPIVLVRSVLQPLLAVEIVRRPQLRGGRVAVGVWAGTITLTGVAIIAGPAAASFVYGGRYDELSGLVVPLAVASGLLLGEVLPRSYVVGRAAQARLNQYVLVQLAIAGLGAAVAVMAAVTYGVTGVAWAGVGIAGFRVTAAYAYRARPHPGATTMRSS